MPAGSVMFYVGTVWHGGGANHTDERRLGVILEYCASWVRAQENHITAIGEDVIRTLDPRLQELLGYNIFPPFLGYVDGRHPRRTLMGEHDPLGTRPLLLHEADEDLHDLRLARSAWVAPALVEDLGGQALGLTEQAEQQVLGADVVVAHRDRLGERAAEHLGGERGERRLGGPGVVARARGRAPARPRVSWVRP